MKNINVVQFPSGSNLPHVFVNETKYPSISGGKQRVTAVTVIPNRFETLKPVNVVLACGHNIAGIVYIRSYVDQSLRHLTPDNYTGVCVTCPVCSK